MNNLNHTTTNNGTAIGDEFGPHYRAAGKYQRNNSQLKANTPPKGPWDKQMLELSKYDWHQAVGLSQLHKNRPLDLRVAYALMQFADSTAKLAWPTQKTLARYAGVANERQVRTALKSLRASGAVTTAPLCKLKQSERERINRHGRGIAYRLNMFWASEIFEGDPKVIRMEPPPLRGKASARKRTEPHRSSRTGGDRSGQDGNRPHNPNEKLDYTECGNEGEDEAPAKKTNAYAQAKCRID